MMDGWIEVSWNKRQSQSTEGGDNFIPLSLISSIIVIK